MVAAQVSTAETSGESDNSDTWESLFLPIDGFNWAPEPIDFAALQDFSVSDF